MVIRASHLSSSPSGLSGARNNKGADYSDFRSKSHIYFGFAPEGKEWFITRVAIATSVLTRAVKDSNNTQTTLADAWAARTGLTYNVF